MSVYQPVPGWERLPDGWSFIEVVGIATDSQDRVFVYNRGQYPIIVFDCDGNFLYAWGEGQFVRPHGIWIGADDSVYLTDDMDHTVRKYSPRGKLLLALGESGLSSNTGVQNSDYRTITNGGSPFNQPTNLALSINGEMYISDGYGNARIHKFSPTGELILSWGEPGDAPGQFNLPHGICINNDGQVLVADRENSRIQFFTPNGEYIQQWTDVARPCEVFVDSDGQVYVAELGYHAGMFPWMSPDESATGGRVSIFDREGNLLTRLGGGNQPCSPGDFYAPHDIWVDSQGSIYVGEVIWSAGGKQGLVSADCPSLQKFLRT